MKCDEWDSGLGTDPEMWEMLSDILEEEQIAIPISLSEAIIALQEKRAWIVMKDHYTLTLDDGTVKTVFFEKDDPMREIPMLPYQQRLIDEKTQLDERLGKLTAFFDTEPFPDLPQAEQDRRRRQATHMKRYSDILGERIEAWEQQGK